MRRLAPRLLAGILAGSFACARPPSPPTAAVPGVTAPPPASAPANPLATATSSAPGTATAPATPDDEAIDRAAAEYLDLLVAISPETATQLGNHSRDTELDGYTRDEEEATLRREEALLAELRARFPSPRASRAKKTDLALLESALAVDVRVRRAVKPLERKPDAYTDPLGALFQMATHEYAPVADRARASLARLERVPAIVALARSNLTRPPRVWVQVGIEEAASAAEFLDGERTFLADALAPGDRPHIDAAIGAAKRAYADYAAFLRRDVLPRATGEFAAGPELFAFLLHDGYFLDETPGQLYDLGERVFARTQAEMDAVARRIDPHAASWPEVTRRVKSHHPNADDLIPSYRNEVERARRFLAEKDVVPFPPGDDCLVLETPPFLRSTTIAAYEPAPPLDPQTRGFFYVTPVDPKLTPAQREEFLRENDHGDQVDTVAHETYPGHHLQLSFGRGYPSLVRKMIDAKRAAVIGQNVFAEGWGLYAEELMNELGYYTDEERLMQLEWTLVRAARVLIDVGLHTRGMTFEAAVRMLTDRVHLEHELAVSEVKRYTETPAQPLSYLVGRERIVAMRERYKARAGDAFSLKAFHTEVLSHGTIAPGLVEREIFAE
jgi:uncharacterized protein (DUF885 family)